MASASVTRRTRWVKVGTHVLIKTKHGIVYPGTISKITQAGLTLDSDVAGYVFKVPFSSIATVQVTGDKFYDYSPPPKVKGIFQNT